MVGVAMKVNKFGQPKETEIQVTQTVENQINLPFIRLLS
jgi:hypothetical protein